MNARPQRRLLDQLRARGIRLTSQRSVLVSILDAEEGFVDAAALCMLAKRKGVRVDRATVYRTLALLRDNNLLAAGDRAEAAVAAPAKDELGLVCDQCGTRQPIAADAPGSIKRELQRCTGFDASAVRLEARGECRLCAAKSRLRGKSKN